VKVNESKPFATPRHRAAAPDGPAARFSLDPRNRQFGLTQGLAGLESTAVST